MGDGFQLGYFPSVPEKDRGPIAARGGGATEFEHQNWLGTERLRTSYNGAVVISIASLPWADGHTPSGDNGDQHDFAQMDRDLEDNTEHAQYRQYSTNLGRWLGPDQYKGSYDFTNPQSFNRYAYALNDPVNMLDPSGLRACQYAGGGCNGQQGGGDDDSAYYVDGVQVNAALASTIINLDGGLSFFFELGSTNSAPVGNGLGPYTMQTNVSGLEVDLDPFGFIIPSSSSSVGFVDPGVAPNNPTTCADNPVNQVGGNLHQNIQVSNALTALSLLGGPFGSVVALGTYYGLVHTGGPWDFKNSAGPGTHDQRVAAGNVNYGATCFIGDEACQYAAGLYGKLSGNPGTAATHFDIPTDNQQIQQGQALRKKGC